MECPGSCVRRLRQYRCDMVIMVGEKNMWFENVDVLVKSLSSAADT